MFILGADFLHHHGLVVDILHRALCDPQTQLQVNGFAGQLSSTGISHPRQESSNAYLALHSAFIEELVFPLTHGAKECSRRLAALR